ncbi:hypothetical protein [Ruicaihuangia caeni]|uniref:hypothetical protein n=1 Tax=Ruicaihuangia caeni TaxID=3042517 RepID=UPI003390377D
MKPIARLLGSRRIMRLSVPFFRAGLGFLFCGRIAMIEHQSEEDGQVHRTVLEVIGSDAPGSVLVVAGPGTDSHWCEHLAAEPKCWISVGLQYRRPARAEVLGHQESRALLAGHAARYSGLREVDRQASAVERGGSGHEPRVVRLSWQATVRTGAPAIAPVLTPGG